MADIEVQKVVFGAGVQYGRTLRDELVSHRVLAPFSLASLPLTELVSPYVMLTFKDNPQPLQPFKIGMRKYINSGTAYYLMDLHNYLVNDIGDIFANIEFKDGIKQLIEDVGGYDGSFPIKLITDVPYRDFESITFNTDAHWIDYARTKSIEYTPYIIFSSLAFDAISMEIFPRYRQYIIHRTNSDEQAKRIASSVFIANANMHFVLYDKLRHMKEQYSKYGFLRAIETLNQLLIESSNRAMKGLDT